MSVHSPDASIRRMSDADISRVMEIAASLRDAPKWQASAYFAAIDSGAVAGNAPRRIALVAADAENDAPAGFLVASLMPPDAELETIAVSAEGQRQGVGGLLLKALIEELGTERATGLTLEVRASNQAALGLYRVIGFVEAGRRPRYYADPEDDAVLMRLRLMR